MRLTRTYQVKLYPNYHKGEELAYLSSRYRKYLQHFATQLFYYSKLKSTQSMGQLANQAQHEAQGIIKAGFAANEETGNKFNPPIIANFATPCTIKLDKNTTFDYWVTIPSPFNRFSIPAKSHRKLNDKLRNGWEISSGEVFLYNNIWYCRIFVTKEVAKALPQIKILGIDIGYRNSVARSDGYLGYNQKAVAQQERDAQKERSRQGHKRKSIKTQVKQLLDVEVNRAIGRSKAYSQSLAIENPKVIVNLRNIPRWARTYFSSRLQVRASEESIFVFSVNPRNTSLTCNHCGKIDRRSRVKAHFRCVSCKKELNADINAALNIAQRGSEASRKYLAKVAKNRENKDPLAALQQQEVAD